MSGRRPPRDDGNTRVGTAAEAEGSPGGEAFGDQLPSIRVEPPGPRSLELARRLRHVESRNVTDVGPEFPVFWSEARGANVRDVDGNVFLDLTGAFGVGIAGHAHPEVRRRLREQSERLIHGMGDIHPPALKVELLERLARLSPWADARSILTTSGAEAVEAALKTGQLASGRPGAVAFTGGYHGLTLGSLSVTDRDHFRAPFRRRLYGGVHILPWPGHDAPVDEVLERLDRALADTGPDAVGTVILEPIQARGGVRIPPAGVLAAIAKRTRAAGAVLVYDEIFTGLGRTGRRFALEHDGVLPDVLCVGKSLGGGMPLSACIAPADVMDAWPASTGEAIHTSTFLGHPLSLAGALAFLDVFESEDLAGRADALGRSLQSELARRTGPEVREIRGRGLLIGLELEATPGDPQPALSATVRALRRGLLVLPAGPDGTVVELAPSALLTHAQATWAVGALSESLRGDAV